MMLSKISVIGFLLSNSCKSFKRTFHTRRTKEMIIKTSNGLSIDTEIDLSATERHILQKLFAWKSFVKSIDEFREKKDQSFQVGWNNSGPVKESSAMRYIISDIEKEISLRLRGKNT